MFLWTPAFCSWSWLIPSTLPTSTSADFLNSHFIDAFPCFILTWWWKRPGKAQLSLRKYHRTPPCPKSQSIISSISSSPAIQRTAAIPEAGRASFLLPLNVCLYGQNSSAKSNMDTDFDSPCRPYLPAPASPWHCNDFPSDHVNICSQAGWIWRGAATPLCDQQLPLCMSPPKTETHVKGLVSLVLFCNGGYV